MSWSDPDPCVLDILSGSGFSLKSKSKTLSKLNFSSVYIAYSYYKVLMIFLLGRVWVIFKSTSYTELGFFSQGWDQDPVNLEPDPQPQFKYSASAHSQSLKIVCHCLP